MSSVIGVAVGDGGIGVVNIEKKTHVERIMKDRGEEEQERTLKKSAVPMSTFNMGIKSHEDDARKSMGSLEMGPQRCVYTLVVYA